MWLEARMQLLPGEERELDKDRPKWLELRVEISRLAGVEAREQGRESH
jgi:hypothetical protein